MDLRSHVQSQLAQQNYQGATQSAPKEIGFMQRIEGARVGLDSLVEKTEALVRRIAGAEMDPNKASGGTLVQPGLPDELTSIEERVRRLHQLIDGMSAAF